ncbi:recQ-mediated genome instability protein 1-like [Anopheles aquasalis]|uniref:recQ-mediated genome instability protein 1-like n=1 Tax=Anopheles aquasalis TaxID=42839 RepID=UPI00215A9E68|nr:recQ-mediated genome instability protein 1-like [Anopheles aquasalis]
MIQNDNVRVQQVKLRFVREFNIKVIDEWLTGCVSFCLQENPQTTNESLFEFAFSQWLLADLREIGVAVLPAGFNGRTEQHTLNGSFPIQMHQLIDISESVYDQWRKMYDKKLDEADDEVQMRKSQTQHTKKRRMLKLELSDGKQTVTAMEHSPIRCLNTKLAPGSKILLTGPLRCINSVLLLEPKNVRILGGEIDVLLIDNAYENVLLRAMHKPVNPNPKIEYEEPEVVECRTRNNYGNIPSIPMTSQSQRGHTTRPHRQTSPSAIEVEDGDDDSLLLAVDLDSIETSQPRREESKPEQVPAISTLMDDDELDELVNLIEDPVEPEIMNEQVSSTRYSQPSPVRPQPRPIAARPSPPPQLAEPDEDDFDLMNSLENEIQNEMREYQAASAFAPSEWPMEPDEETLRSPQMKKSRLSNEPEPVMAAKREQETNGVEVEESASSKRFDQFNAISVFEDSLDAVIDLDSVSMSSIPGILSPSYAFRIDNISLVTIEQLDVLDAKDRVGRSFVVFGEVIDLVEPPRIKKQMWHMGIKLSDNTAPGLSVRLRNDVVVGMIPTRPNPGELMRRNLIDREATLKLLDTMLGELNQVLHEIRCFWRVDYTDQQSSSQPAAADELPTVIKRYEMTDERRTLLMRKISKENCGQLRDLL